MPPTNKPNLLSIAGTIIAILLAIIGYFLNGVYEEIKEVRAMLTSILVANGELNKDMEILKEDQRKVWEKIRAHDEQVLNFYQGFYETKAKR